MFRSFPGYALLGITLVLLAFNSHAQLYKWVDDNGKVHYSDKVPEGKVGTPVTSSKKSNSANAQQHASQSAKPIIRPYEKTSRKLHLLDLRYLWKSESQVNRTTRLGVYHSGKGCTSRGAIKTPDVFIHHKALFPQESTLTRRVSKVINGLDYDSERTEKYRLLGRLKKTGGLSLHAEIIDLDFNTCAPSIRKSERLKAIETISPHRFTKHRVRLQVRWQLRTNRDQDLVYEAVTAGGYNGWNYSASSESAIGNALESAVLKLFSDREFIASVLVEEDGGDLKNIQFSSLKPINMEAGARTQKLFVLADGKGWIKQLKTDQSIGHMLFGENCAARRPMPLGVALNSQKWLAADSYSTSNAIVKSTRPLGYSISPANADTLASLSNNGGYSLNARVTRVTYDACAPALSASTKYKPVDKISFRRMQRNRVQIWVDWTLKSDRNRKLLYKTSTMGFAGSLLTDTRGKDAMSEAIGMAAGQLFADPDFVQLITLKQRAVPAARDFAARDNSSVRGILLPEGREPIRLLIVNPDKTWARIGAGEAVGLYAYGSDCTPYRERGWPQALNDYPRLFPSKKEIAGTAGKIVKSLGYPYQVADEYSVVSMKRKLDAYSLHAEIVELRFDSCAPDLDEKLAFSKRKISSGQFKRHRASLRIHWRLLGSGDELLFDKTTEGVVDSWLLNAKGKEVVASAIANATSELFTEPDFVARLVVDSPEDEGLFASLLGMFDSDSGEDSSATPGIGNRYLLQAHLAQAFSELNALKVGSLQHYMMEGEWPDNVNQLGYSDSLFNQSESIAYVNFQSDGSMVVELKEIFGDDKIITLSPDADDGNVSMNRWRCSSNLDQAYLPQTCEGL